MLLILRSGAAPAPAAGVDTRRVIARLVPLLNAADTSGLIHWTEAQLWGWINEALARLGRGWSVIVERVTFAVSGADPDYVTPARTVAVIHVTLGTALLAATVAELEALDGAWPVTTNPPSRWTLERPGLLRLYPTPTGGGTAAAIVCRYPAEVSSGSPLLTAPRWVEDYLLWRTLAGARKAESDGAMPEVAAHFDERAKLIEAVIADYWGAIP